MKTCTKCKQELPLSEFRVYKGRIFSYCNVCNKIACAEWREKNRERSRLVARERARGKVILEGELWYEKKREQARRLYKKHGYKPIEVEWAKRRAREAIRDAIKRGHIEKPNSCSYCGRKRYITGHHPDYNERLSVIWLCVPCHKNLHLGRQI